MSLPVRHKKLLTPEGFDELFERELSRHRTHEEAFNELKKESLVIFGQCRYDNFKSYQNARARRIKNRQHVN